MYGYELTASGGPPGGYQPPQSTSGRYLGVAVTLSSYPVQSKFSPLYANFHVPGICPIGSEPEEPTPKKPEGGLMSKLDRLLHLWSITHSTPAISHTYELDRRQKFRKRLGHGQILAPIEESSDPTLLQRIADPHSHYDNQVTPAAP